MSHKIRPVEPRMWWLQELTHEAIRCLWQFLQGKKLKMYPATWKIEYVAFPSSERNISLSIVKMKKLREAKLVFIRETKLCSLVFLNKHMNKQQQQTSAKDLFFMEIEPYFHFLAVFSGACKWVITAFILHFVPFAFKNSKWY